MPRTVGGQLDDDLREPGSAPGSGGIPIRPDRGELCYAEEVISTSSSSGITRSRIDALQAAGPPSLEAIADAVRAVDYDTAASAALARAVAGAALSIEAVAPILPQVRNGVVLYALIVASSGDRMAAVFELLRHRRIPCSRLGDELAALLLYAAWRLNEDSARRPLFAPFVRTLARSGVGAAGAALLTSIVDEIGDATLERAAMPGLFMNRELAREFSREMDGLLAQSAREIIARLPEAEAPRQVTGFTVRSGPKPGRNDLCPCGSGKKYKRCCQDKADTSAPSPVAGLSWDEYLASAAGSMTPEIIDALPLHDLARVDFTKLARLPLIVAARRCEAQRRWDLAERALDVLGDDDFREELIEVLIDCREWDLARKQVDRMHDPGCLHESTRVALALGAEQPNALPALIGAATGAVAEAGQRAATNIDLAHVLLKSVPALGILVARGCLSGERRLDATVLLEAIEEARDELNLPPGDAAWDLWAAIDGSEKVEDKPEPKEPEQADDTHAVRLAAELGELRSALRGSSSRVVELERELEKREKLVATATAEVTPDAAVVRRLQAKVAELKSLIGEGNTERRELRRKLAAAASARSVAMRTNTDDPGDDEGEPFDAGTSRALLIPRFSRRSESGLAAVPTTIAAEALRTIGSLAAGDAAAWRGVKQAKDMPRSILMARIGIHHRLLFRAEAGALEVIDLIPRERLDLVLKQLRAA